MQASILDELRRREPIFHRPEFGSTLQDYDNAMDESYWEVGASGKVYSREFILQHLAQRRPDPDEGNWVSSDFKCREIAAGNYLLQQGARSTRRATLWRRTATGWQIVYHQGTVVSAAT